MPASALDSGIHAGLFGDAELAALFTETAEIEAMTRVLAALARAQGAQGVIPAASAAHIGTALPGIKISAAALAPATARNGVPIPALVAALRKKLGQEHGAWLHWGATSQDIVDTGLVLRLDAVVTILRTRLEDLVLALGVLASAHAALPMAARTYGQVATVTSLGALAAEWGAPLLTHLDRLAALRPRLLRLSLAGAAGTLSAMGPKAPAVRAAMARELGLGDARRSWHAGRDGIAEFAGWLTMTGTAVGKFGADLVLLTQSAMREVTLAGTGGSSTMPQKTNPVQPSAVVALSQLCLGLNQVMQGAALHRQQRDGAAWMAEWLALPQMVIATGRALALGAELAGGLTPDVAAMRRGIDAGQGVIHAEALAFALAARMPRPVAQAAVAELCAQVRQGQGPLAELAAAAWPDQDFAAVFDPARQMGQAPAEARAFARRAARCRPAGA